MHTDVPACRDRPSRIISWRAPDDSIGAFRTSSENPNVAATLGREMLDEAMSLESLPY